MLRYKGYHIFKSYKKVLVVSYANDFKTKTFKTIEQAKRFIDRFLNSWLNAKYIRKNKTIS